MNTTSFQNHVERGYCHGGHGSANHRDHSEHRMGASQMDMTFFSATSTPLFSVLWTPKSNEEYAGTCIFLVIMMIIMQALIALKPVLDNEIWRKAQTHRGGCGSRSADPEQANKVASASSQGGRFMDEIRKKWASGRFVTDCFRATYVLVLLGIGYLLMLAVMTMNVGYFMSVLAGGFLGSLAFGRFGSEGSSPDACH